MSFIVRFVAVLLAALVLMVALGLAALRWIILPNIDDYRPAVERLAGRAMDAPVRIGRLQAEWRDWSVRLDARELSVAGPDGGADLKIAAVQATVSARSFATRLPEFDTAAVRGLRLVIRRDARGGWWVGGHRLVRDDRERGDVFDNPAIDWLARQSDLALVDARVELHDERADAAPLVLEDANASLRHGRLQAEAAFADGQALTLNGELASVGGEAGGHLTLTMPGVDLAQWQAWLPAGAPTVHGRAELRARLTLAPDALATWSGELAFDALDIAGEAVGGSAGRGTAELSGDTSQRRVRAQIALTDVELRLSTLFEDPDVPIPALQGTLTLHYPAGAAATWNFADVRADVGEPGARASIDVSGAWRNAGRTRAGVLTLQGTVAEADAGAVGRFMPRQVGPGVRRWLRDGILAGSLSGVSVRLAGDLADFPFDHDHDTGFFRVDGALHDVALDVSPHGEDRWPAFEGLEARLFVDRGRLEADIERGEVRAGLPAPVAIGATRVVIPHLRAGEAELTVAGEALGPANAFLDYVQATALTRFTGGVLQFAEGTGELRVPLTVVAPLGRLGDTRVTGEVEFADNTLRLHPQAPAFTAVQGSVVFDNDSVAARQVRGQWVGNPLSADGHVVLAGGGQIDIRGRVDAAALRAHWPAAVLERFEGGADIDGVIRGGAGGPALTVTSDLQGLAMRLPAPLTKPARHAWPLRVHVGQGERDGARQVTIALEDRVGALLEFGGGPADAPLAWRAGVGVKRPAVLPAEGVALDAVVDRLNVGDWADALESAAADVAGDEGGVPGWARRTPLTMSLRTEQLDVAGLRFDAVDLSGERKAAGDWQASVDARQAAGTMSLSAGDPMRLHARFARLDLQTDAQPASSEAAPEPSARADDDPPLPDVDVEVDDFRVGGREFGHLRLDAANVDGERDWRVRELVLENADGRLAASGQWASANGTQRRRTTLDVALAVHDAGRLLGRLGWPDAAAGGHGFIKGSVGWEGMPFSYEPQALDAHLGVALDEGRFVQAPAGRLLSVLSLQALARSAAFREGNLFADGFAWETIRSQIAVDRGRARIEGFDMTGPAATVVLSGEADLMAETQNLHAVVVPHVDASTAALLAGVAVNPVVGVGAFLGQWLLQRPLAEAFTTRYRVTGTWADPQVEQIETRAPVNGQQILP